MPHHTGTKLSMNFINAFDHQYLLIQLTKPLTLNRLVKWHIDVSACCVWPVTTYEQCLRRAVPLNCANTKHTHREKRIATNLPQ